MQITKIKVNFSHILFPTIITQTDICIFIRRKKLINIKIFKYFSLDN